MTAMTSNSERETHLNMMADDRDFWEAASNDPVMIDKLDKIGAVLLRQRGETRFYRLPANQVTLRNRPAPLTDEQRAAAVARAEAMNRAKAGKL